MRVSRMRPELVRSWCMDLTESTWARWGNVVLVGDFRRGKGLVCCCGGGAIVIGNGLVWIPKVGENGMVWFVDGTTVCGYWE